MPQRPSPRPRPQSLPFEEDAAVSQQTPHSAPPPPTAFITYTHDTPEHKERVLKLTQKLRADGVDCDLDAFQVSPSEGWPAWMLRAVQTHHFCIVVCTETYARRFDGNETPGQGKGAVWEGRAILQRLYESGKNDCVIPVVFAPHDVPHIPLLLKGATHYILGSDLGTDDGYIRLHRALTNQPLDARGPVRVLTRFVQKYTVKGLGGAGSSISTSNSRPRDQPRRRQRDLVARTARVGREVRRRAQRLRALYRCASRAAAAVVGTQGKGASLGCARRSRSRCERPAAQSTGLSMEWGLGGIF